MANEQVARLLRECIRDRHSIENAVDEALVEVEQAQSSLDYWLRRQNDNEMVIRVLENVRGEEA